MATKNLKMTMDRVGRVEAALKRLGRGRVLVGIPADHALRKPEPGEASAPNNAMLGFIHENGSPASNIPARPFLVPGIQEAKEPIADLLEGDIKKTLTTGGGRSPEQTLHAVGILAQNAVRKKIVDGPFAPLKPKTLAARRRKGRKGTKPLIDTGQLKNAITYVVEGG
jgi:phage gpG-like protein